MVGGGRRAIEGQADPSRRGRLDIQGLRAVAVLMVVAFHAGMPTPGGFAGVDVFFVISGFVITAMLQREWASTGRVDLLQFYARRFKRLTPALALVVLVVTCVAALVLSPFGAEQTAAKTAVGAVFLSANWVITNTTRSYFAPGAETNPLLNTWSLSVEEQFYLAFPLILSVSWMAARRARSWFASILPVVCLAAVSFGLALAAAPGQWLAGSWLTGFYGPLGRAWEFAVGAILALVVTRIGVKSTFTALLLGGSGAVLVLSSLFLITRSTPFPGPWTLLPVVGTLLLITAGTHDTNAVTRLLTIRPLVLVGDWSYAIYLWHWPLIVFAKTLWPADWEAPVIAAVLSLAPALISYRWVEQPIRRMHIRTRRGWALLTSCVLLPPLLSAGALAFVAKNVWGARFASGELPAVYQGDIGQGAFEKFVAINGYPCLPMKPRDSMASRVPGAPCVQSKIGEAITMAIVGDSHAGHFFPGLALALPDQNVADISGLKNPPVGITGQPAEVVNYLVNSPELKVVIVSMQWFSKGVDTEALTAGLTEIANAGISVFVMDDVPDFRFDPYICKYGKIPMLPWTECTQDADRFWGIRYAKFFSGLQRVVRSVPGAQLLNTARYFCDEATCDMTHDGTVLYRDPSHLNIDGSVYVTNRLLREYPAIKNAQRRVARPAR